MFGLEIEHARYGGEFHAIEKLLVTLTVISGNYADKWAPRVFSLMPLQGVTEFPFLLTAIAQVRQQTRNGEFLIWSVVHFIRREAITSVYFFNDAANAFGDICKGLVANRPTGDRASIGRQRFELAKESGAPFDRAQNDRNHARFTGVVTLYGALQFNVPAIV